MRFVPRFRRGRAAPPRRTGQTETLVQDEAAGAPPIVEEEEAAPPPPPPRPVLWPWLLLLLLLVAGGLAAVWFLTRDNDHHKRGSTVTVPRVIGEQQASAVDRLNRAGLASHILSKASSAPAGTVFAEDPHAGATVTRGSTITLSVSSAATVTVPNVVGTKASSAVPILQRRGLTVQTSSVASRKPAGVVLAQSPEAGARVAKGSTEVIRVSRGLVQVPNVVGQRRTNAVSSIRGAGLVPQAFTVPSTQPKGTVVAQRPRAGVRVPRGSKVRLNLSNGRSTGGVPPPPPPPPPPPATATVAVPDVTDQPQEAAQRRLNTVGLKAGVVYVPSDQPQGTVVSQSPSAGTTVRRGTRIQLNASLGPNPGAQQTVPNVVGMSPQAATSRLSSAGFKVQRLTRKVSVRNQNGVVVDEQPAGGRKAPAGSTVTIYVGRFSG